ncbi:MAG: hypothetical protein ACH36H_10925 [Candidatus Nanopelagicales bacterium]
MVDTGDEADTIVTSADESFRTTPKAADTPESAAFTQASLTLTGQPPPVELALGDEERLTLGEPDALAAPAGVVEPADVVEPEEQPARTAVTVPAPRAMVRGSLCMWVLQKMRGSRREGRGGDVG